MKLLLLLTLLAAPVSIFAEGGLPTQPYIYVEGKAEIEKPADMVTLRFDLVARNADQAKANQEVQAKAGKILALFAERKVAASDIIATDLKSEPQYEGDDEASARKRGKIVGYSVTRSFTADVRDVAAFAKLVDDLLAISGVEFSGINAGLSKKNEMQVEVWHKALNNAHEIAEKTVEATGMKIDSVFALSPVSFPEISTRMFRSNETVMSMSSSAASEGAAPPPYRLSPISMSQSVHVIYLISPK